MASTAIKLTPAEEKLVMFANRMFADWYDGTVFVTPTKAFDMRVVVERCRKNYYGIYDSPYDEVTGLEKYWVPLSEHIAETVTKATDVDTKSFVPYSENPALFGASKVFKLVLRDKLRRMK